MDISTPFVVLNQGSQDLFLNFAWKPIPDAVKYKLFWKKLNNLFFDETTSQFTKKDSAWKFVAEIPTQALNDKVYQYKHIIHAVSKEYGEIIPSLRGAYRKYQYKIEAFDSKNTKISVSEDKDFIVDAHILPDNAFSALNDIDKNLLHSLIISGGFLSTDFVGNSKTLEQMRPKTLNGSSVTGPVFGTHEITKIADSDSIEYKWDNYNFFDTIRITGTLKGKLEIWKRYDKITKQWTKIDKHKYDYQGLMVVLNGTLEISGMYTATLQFENYVVIDNVSRMGTVGGELDAGKTGGNLVITYNGQVEKIEHNQKGRLYASNDGVYTNNNEFENRYYSMKSKDMALINHYRKQFKLENIVVK